MGLLKWSKTCVPAGTVICLTAGSLALRATDVSVSEVETFCGETVWAERKVAEANTKKIAPRM
jgi:hypothetical protein